MQRSHDHMFSSKSNYIADKCSHIITIIVCIKIFTSVKRFRAITIYHIQMEINMLNVFRLFLFFYKEIIYAKNDLKWEGNNSECT